MNKIFLFHLQGMSSLCTNFHLVIDFVDFSVGIILIPIVVVPDGHAEMSSFAQIKLLRTATKKKKKDHANGPGSSAMAPLAPSRLTITMRYIPKTNTTRRQDFMTLCYHAKPVNTYSTSIHFLTFYQATAISKLMWLPCIFWLSDAKCFWVPTSHHPTISTSIHQFDYCLKVSPKKVGAIYKYSFYVWCWIPINLNLSVYTPVDHPVDDICCLWWSLVHQTKEWCHLLLHLRRLPFQDRLFEPRNLDISGSRPREIW